MSNYGRRLTGNVFFHTLYFISANLLYSTDFLLERERERGIYLTDWLIKFGPNFAQCSLSSHHPPFTILYILNDAAEPYDKFCITPLSRDQEIFIYILETQFVNVRCLLSSEYKLFIGTCLWEGSMPERKINKPSAINLRW